MRITYRDGFFIGAAGPDEGHAFKRAGFTWHPSPNECTKDPQQCAGCRRKLHKVWITTRLESAARLASAADSAAQAALAEHLRAVEASRAADSEIEIPAPKGLSYLGYQRAGIAYLSARKSAILGDEQGLGKAQPLDASILTPDGWTPMGTIERGSLVIGSDGLPHKVTGVFPQGKEKVYEITFSDGAKTRCSAHHLWKVYTQSPRDIRTPTRNRGGQPPSQILSLNQIREHLAKLKPNEPSGLYIPLVAPRYQFEKGVELPLDPFLIGYSLAAVSWIRQGEREGAINQLYLSQADNDDLGEELRKTLPAEHTLTVSKNNFRYYNIKGKDEFGFNAFKQGMRAIGAFNIKYNKRTLPEACLAASPAERFAILQGLLEAKGKIEPRYNSIDFRAASEAMIDGVQSLVWSLGGTATKAKSKFLGEHHLHIVLPLELGCPFRSRAQSKEWRPRSQHIIRAVYDIPVREIVKVRYLKYEETQCISVESPDHLYVTDDYVLTHNTIQILGTVNKVPDIKNVLVVAPNTLRLNWFREAKKWLVEDGGRRWNYYIVDEDEPVPTSANFVIVHYQRISIGQTRCSGPCEGEKRRELVCPTCEGTGNGERPRTCCRACGGRKFIFCPECKGRGRVPGRNLKIVHSLFERKWDLLAVDEAHFIKNPQSSRTKAIIGNPFKRTPGLVHQAEKTFFLTGTPLPNRPIEMWPLLSVCAPDQFGDYRAFAKRYCDAHQEFISKTKKVWKVDGASNLEELQERMRAHCLIRRSKSDVLTDLPPKTRQVIPLLPTPEAKRLIAMENSLWEQKFAADVEMVNETISVAENTGDDQSYNAAVERLRYIQNVAFMEMARVRHDVAVAKIPSVLEHLTNLFEEGVGKIICFAHHHDVIRAIGEEFSEIAVFLYGETKSEDRQKAVDRFQTDPDVKLFVGGIQAAGVGLTLTAAAHVVFAELDWVPSNVRQCEDRAHRIGQQNSVLIQHLVLDGSLDARMAQLLVEKQEIADRALDRPTDVTLQGAPARRPEAIAPPMESWRKILLKDALVHLAKLRDPDAKDGHGFSHFDATIGNKLATWKGQLSNGQASIADKLAFKYRRQLPPAMVSQLGFVEPKEKGRRPVTKNKTQELSILDRILTKETP